MALTEEQLVLQADILASKTDSTTNPNMPYKTNATLNKGLNPTYFSGNYTKIVNALNQIATNADSVNTTVLNVAEKVNSVLLDTTVFENEAIWTAVQGLMGEATIIEGLQNILEGNTQQQILGLTEDSVGKVLSIVKDEDGVLRTEAIEVSGAGGETEVSVEDIIYANDERPEFSNVKQVLDYLLENEGSGSGETGGTVSSIDWADVTNKPVIPTDLIITDSQVCLQANGETISIIELVTDSDIDAIIEQLA